MDEHTLRLELEYVLRYPFAVIDAALHNHLRSDRQFFSRALELKRTRITEGSARYALYFPNAGGLGVMDVCTIQVRAIANDKTYIKCNPASLVSDMTQEEHEEHRKWCKFLLIVFLGDFWMEQNYMARLDAVSPTPADTYVIYNERTREETRIPAPRMRSHGSASATSETTSVPPVPDPADGLEELLTWFDRYGSAQGLNIDQMARRVGLAPKTLYNARHASGRTRKKGTGKKKEKTKEIEGNSGS